MEVTNAFLCGQVVDADGNPAHRGMVASHLQASCHEYSSATRDQVPAQDCFDRLDSAFPSEISDMGEHSSAALATNESTHNGATCFMAACTVPEPGPAHFVGSRATLGHSLIWDQPKGFAQGQSKRRPWSGAARRTLFRVPQTQRQVTWIPNFCHTPNEFVRTDAILEVARTYARIALNFCQVAGDSSA